MNIRFLPSSRLSGHATELLAVPVFETATEAGVPVLPDDLDASVLERVPEGDVRGRVGAKVLAHTGSDGGPRRLLLLGVGKAADLDAEGIRRYAGRAVRAAEELRVTELTLRVPAAVGIGADRAGQAAAEGALLAAWRFSELKSGEGIEGDSPAPLQVTDVTLAARDGDLPEIEMGGSAGAAIARGQNLARTLQARPGNVATPSHLAEEARRVAATLGLAVTVLGPEQLEAEGMRALLAVSRGSEEEPRLIVLEHRGGQEGDPPLVLVGKGLTFDSGGISIKPASGMEDMKYDMSAGAAVLGAMHAIAELSVAANVVGVVPSSENLLSGRAMKPGDIIRTRAGKTVEVLNTDAEGRLILCDALDYARGLEPAAMVDCATLTGAVVVGLGHHAAAVLGTDDGLVEELREAGDRAGERCWPLPLWPEYRKQLESEAADLKNIGGRPGGAITAACFLREFVGDVPWAHLDIAGMAYGTEPLPYQRKGGYGFPTRLLVEWVRSRAG